MKTVKVDSGKRVRLPDAKPGQVFSYEPTKVGELVEFKLTQVKPAEMDSRPTKVRFVKRGRYTVGESDRPVDMKVVKELC